jgi:hypothetical protein
MGTPSEQLASRIAKRLVSEHLLTEDGANRLEPQIAAGTLRSEDWRLPIEVAEDKGDKQ